MTSLKYTLSTVFIFSKYNCVPRINFIRVFQRYKKNMVPKYFLAVKINRCFDTLNNLIRHLIFI